MHELSIALNIIDLATSEAEQHDGGRLKAIHLKIGPLSGVVTEALVSAYELATERSPLEECRLHVEETPVVIHCPSCDSDQPAVSVQQLVCASCATPSAEIVSGRELDLVALEIEE